jgi:hypothetical protein
MQRSQIATMPSLLGVLAVTTASEPSGPTGGGDGDDAPASEIRPLETEPRCLLRVFNGLRLADPAGAWLIVSDDAGVVRFEGPLTEEGVEVDLPLPRLGCKVCLHLETSSWHRQAQVELTGDLVEHVFA